MSNFKFASLAFFVLLAGCGGDLGSCSNMDDSGASASSSGPSPSSSIRANVNGDSFHYAVAGTYSQAGGVQHGATSGTATENFGSTTLLGKSVVFDTLAITIPLQNGIQTQTTQRQRDASGTIVAETDAGNLQAVTVGQVTIPSSYGTNVSLGGTEALANGTTIAESYKVVDVDTIDSPAGSFDCWKVLETMNYSDGEKVSKTIWLSPDLGAPAQETIIATFPNGLSEQLTLVLQSDTLG